MKYLGRSGEGGAGPACLRRRRGRSHRRPPVGVADL